MTCIFASDLHLSGTRPAQIDLFESFLVRASKVADSLYLLGDLFELWLGDDDDSDSHPKVMRALREFSDSGTQLFVMHGNRDFLFGPQFAEESGASLLTDWHTIDLYGTRTLLTHGDLLCTKDVQYQQFRKYVRDPGNQKTFLGHPLHERRKIAAQTQRGTKASMLEKDDFIMDVDQITVEQVMGDYDVARLIHGHTHRPATHTFVTNGRTRERVVLGDWYEDSSVVVCNHRGLNRLSAAEFVATTDNMRH